MKGPITPGNANTFLAGCAPGADPGRATSDIPPNWAKQIQLVGIWNDTRLAPGNSAYLASATPALIPFATYIHARLPSHKPTWWTLSLNGWELERTTAVQNLAALDESEILDRGRRMSRVKARVEYEEFRGKRVVDVDVSYGRRMAIFGTAVTVTLLIPSNQQFIDVGSVVDMARTNNLLFGPGLVVDTIIGASCLPSPAPIGDRYGRNTIRVTQDSNVAAAILQEIPAGSQYVTIIPDQGNLLNTPWRFVQAVPDNTPGVPSPGGTDIGDIVIAPGIRRAARVPIPDNATHIRQPGGFLQQRGWQLIFELDL